MVLIVLYRTVPVRYHKTGKPRYDKILIVSKSLKVAVVWQDICYTETEVIKKPLGTVSMRRSDLGEFEELVLLAVAVLTPQAYSVVVAEELEQQTGKTVTTGAVHASLQRLENKGLVSSKMGDATPERGGRRKRIFSVTVSGSRILHEVQDIRNNLWSRIAPQTLHKIKTA